MMRGTTVPGGKREETPGTLSLENRGRWKAGKDTWNTFAGKPCQVEGGEEAPGTLSLEFRARWTAEKRHLEHFRWNSVPGGRQKDATWNTFAGILWQVDSREMPPGTLSQEYRGRWEAGSDTWNTFAGIPCQVDGRK